MIFRDKESRYEGCWESLRNDIYKHLTQHEKNRLGVNILGCVPHEYWCQELWDVADALTQEYMEGVR